jgi:hypothetical protein
LLIAKELDADQGGDKFERAGRQAEERVAVPQAVSAANAAPAGTAS